MQKYKSVLRFINEVFGAMYLGDVGIGSGIGGKTRTLIILNV